ncbi:DUF4183 domain-containing protein [Paenibacillus sp. OV219]|uniref:DUF4183 domain-containing protein n=1 Tax=Paenibacillus sp. OV219 TaxID=1884377 RepID=UPI0008D74456|nr:DUF4183 domain-containing protein [Paenibacillus sp. OV219]SEM82452.1 protein of unknown function [Paenibacillus sp. OV219]
MCDHVNNINQMTPVRMKPLLRKDCIIKKGDIRRTSEFELKLWSSCTPQRKGCTKKKNIACCLKRKTKRKKFRNKIIHVTSPLPQINIIAQQGAQGNPGPPGPTGSTIIPYVNSMLIAKRYFYIASSDIALPADIPAIQFTNDNDESIAGFTDLDQNSYANLYINGIMQVGGSYRVSPSDLTISHENEIVYAGTPIILEIVRLSVQLILKNV